MRTVEVFAQPFARGPAGVVGAVTGDTGSGFLVVWWTPGAEPGEGVDIARFRTAGDADANYLLTVEGVERHGWEPAGPAARAVVAGPAGETVAYPGMTAAWVAAVLVPAIGAPPTAVAV